MNDCVIPVLSEALAGVIAIEVSGGEMEAFDRLELPEPQDSSVRAKLRRPRQMIRFMCRRFTEAYRFNGEIYLANDTQPEPTSRIQVEDPKIISKIKSLS